MYIAGKWFKKKINSILACKWLFKSACKECMSIKQVLFEHVPVDTFKVLDKVYNYFFNKFELGIK